MSTTATDNLGLITDNLDEPWMNIRAHNNSNMTTLDTQIKALQDVIINAKALLGQMGIDENGDPLIDATSARATLGAATDGTNQSSSLYAATQAIAQNASNISSLQDSVSGTVTVLNGTIYNSYLMKLGRIVVMTLRTGKLTSGATIASIPEGFRPAYAIRTSGICVTANLNTVNPAYFEINADGSVIFACDSTYVEVYVTAIWIAAS